MHPRHDSNEESPESQWLFGAVWGAQPQRSPRGIISNQRAITKEALPPMPCFISHKRIPAVFPSRSPQRNALCQNEPSKSDNRTAYENALMAISTHGRTETHPSASRPVWRYATNRRRNQTQNAAIAPPHLAARPPRAQTLLPELQPAKRNISPAHYFTIP